jgi:NAD(P)-dependent dehydrogenase (short-subunit alcohol dehydrogenase family)
VPIYHASKWALEGLSQSLAQEVAPFGVHVTLIEPGGYATDWAGPSAKHATRLSAYDEVRAVTDPESRRRWPRRGDPTASAAALLKVVDAEAPPLRVFFGELPLQLAKADYESRLRNWEQWQPVAELAQG